MSSFAILTYDNDPKTFLKYLESANLANLPTAEQFELHSKYRQAELGEGFRDLSFCVLGLEKPESFILANKFGDFIGFNGSGVAIIEKENSKNSNKYILQHLLDTAVA